MNLNQRVNQYISNWESMGYPEGIPDEVPSELSDFAPSYKAICMTILKNDMYATGLGFSTPKTEWYSELKRIEIQARGK